jgi:hypothetical protein
MDRLIQFLNNEAIDKIVAVLQVVLGALGKVPPSP